MSNIPFVQRTITKEEPYKVCFVCLGNICRSPTAEGVFQHIITKNGLEEYFEVDSAGTSAFHVGEPANSKSRQIAEQRNIKLNSKARQFMPDDLDYFDLILVMDKENQFNVIKLVANDQQKQKVMLLRDFDEHPESSEVPDPYYGGMSGFHNVFDIITRSCENLLDQLKNNIS